MARYDLKPYRWWFMLLLVFGLAMGVAIPWFFGWAEMSYTSAAKRQEYDMRILAGKIEEFREEHDKLPDAVSFLDFTVSVRALEMMGGENLTTYFPGTEANPGLTTPHAYVNDMWPDYFSDTNDFPISYAHNGSDWILQSMGPNRLYEMEPMAILELEPEARAEALLSNTYDPTNGTWSLGDLWRMSE